MTVIQHMVTVDGMERLIRYVPIHEDRWNVEVEYGVGDWTNELRVWVPWDQVDMHFVDETYERRTIMEMDEMFEDHDCMYRVG